MLQETLIESLTSIHAKAPRTHKELTVIPIFGPDLGPTANSLSRGLQRDQVEVREVSKFGAVSQLKVLNRSHRPTFIFDGEELVGGKQCRVVNTSILVPSNEELVIPVSCCEAGRWAHRRRPGFSSLERSMPSSLKAAKSVRLRRNLDDSARYDADQGAVWRDIETLSLVRGVRSRTRALGDVFERDRTKIEELIGAFPHQRGQIGVAAFHGKRLLSLEVFASARLYRQLHETVLHSFASDVLLHRGRPVEAASSYEGDKLLEFAALVLGGSMSSHPSPGIGTDVRVSGERGEATGLVANGQLVHLSVFTR